MKTKLSLLLTLMIGTAFFARAESAAPAGSSGSAIVQPESKILGQGDNGQNQSIPSQNGGQTNRAMPGISTTNSNANSANTNWPGSDNGNNGATNGNGAGGMDGVMETNKSNPYANYTNPNSVYVNPNSTNVNPYANYTNPYAMDAGTNVSLKTNGPGGFYTNSNNGTNFKSLSGMTNGSSVSTNGHHWWKWW